MWKYCFLVQKNCNSSSSNDNDNSNSNNTINSEQIQYSFSQLFKSIKNIKKSCPSSWPASTWSGLPNQGVKLSKSNSGRRDPSRLRLSICFQVNHRNPVALSITCTNFAPKGPKCCSRFVKLLLQPRFPLNFKMMSVGILLASKIGCKNHPIQQDTYSIYYVTIMNPWRTLSDSAWPKSKGGQASTDGLGQIQHATIPTPQYRFIAVAFENRSIGDERWINGSMSLLPSVACGRRVIAVGPLDWHKTIQWHLTGTKRWRTRLKTWKPIKILAFLILPSRLLSP